MKNELTEIQFNLVNAKILNCQLERIQREYDLKEKFGEEKPNEDRYESDKMLKLWLDIENNLESFLEKLGYEYNHFSGRFIYNLKEVVTN